MVKGKEEIPEQEVSEDTTEQEETPTEGQEDIQAQLKEMQEAKVKAEAEAKRLEEGYKGLQTKYNKTYEENKKLADLHAEVGDLKKYIKILAAQQVALSKQDPEDMTPDKQAEHLKHFEEIEKETDKRRQEAEAKAKSEEQFKRFDEIWNEAQKFGTYDDSDQVAEIYDALVDQKLYKAERILKKLQTSKETKVPENKETEDEIFERIAKQKGLLKTDTAVPSGRSGSFEEAEERFASGELSFAEYQEARKKAGIY